MKKNKKEWGDIYVTNKQLALILLGAGALTVFGVLWISGALWQYGLSGIHNLPL